MKAIDEASQAWLCEKAQKGALPKALVDALVARGYDRQSAHYAVQHVYSSLLLSQPKQARDASVPPMAAYEYDECPISKEPIIWACDREVFVRMRLDRPQVIIFDNVLSDEECEELIRRSEQQLQRSATGRGIGEHRTSEGMFIPRCADAFIDRFDRRVASLMNLPVDHGEPTQILRYRPTQEYRPHFDFIDRPETANHAQRGGQRVATLVIYLNAVEAGGETTFPNIGLSIVPKRGSAVYFRYLNHKGQVDYATLHAGAPVIRGEKWVATRWMREHAIPLVQRIADNPASATNLGN